MQDSLRALARSMRDELEKIPPALSQESVVRQTIVCLLFQAVREMGLIPLPSWMPPRSPRERVDLVGAVPGSDPPRLEVAFTVDPLVELPRLKAMSFVECPHKVVLTFSRRLDKVTPTKLFLGKEHLHVNLYG